MTDLTSIREAFARYSAARAELLKELGLESSNRDPLSEVSEIFVAALVEGLKAASRVQRDYDVVGPGDETIQVKYLANPAGPWVNEHEVRVTPGMDAYAIVFFEALLPVATIILPARGLAQVAAALGKRHGSTDTTLQFTRANYNGILKDPTGFAALGVRAYREPEWALLA